MEVKFDDVTVQLSGEDGNVFSIIGRVAKALERAGHKDGAKEFREAAMKSESYDAVIQLAMQTVDVD